MDGRGGCCIARYVGGGAYDMSKVDRIMLRFRPIAPKPIPSGSGSGDSTPEKNDVAARKGKRRYVKDSNNKRCNRKKKASPETKTVTLPLLRESPEYSWVKQSKEMRNTPVWLSFEGGSDSVENQVRFGSGFVVGGPSVVVMPQPLRRVASFVTVECVTDAWVDGEALGCTDDERRRNLEGDTCPGFISDGVGKVTWTNMAYRKMVGEGEEGRCEMRVWLTMKERPPETAAGGHRFPAFTCRVKVQYTWGKEKSSLTVPCDVWRMEGGGYAWRLDVKAALSLGR